MGTTVVEYRVVYAVLAPKVSFKILLAVLVSIVSVTTGVLVTVNFWKGFAGAAATCVVPYSYSVLTAVEMGRDNVL